MYTDSEWRLSCFPHLLLPWSSQVGAENFQALTYPPTHQSLPLLLPPCSRARFPFTYSTNLSSILLMHSQRIWMPIESVSVGRSVFVAFPSFSLPVYSCVLLLFAEGDRPFPLLPSRLGDLQVIAAISSLQMRLPLAESEVTSSQHHGPPPFVPFAARKLCCGLTLNKRELACQQGDF